MFNNIQQDEKQMNEEGLTAIIGIRVYPSWKKQMREEAIAKGETLSEYIYELIDLGLERVEQLKCERMLNKEAKNAKVG